MSGDALVGEYTTLCRRRSACDLIDACPSSVGCCPRLAVDPAFADTLRERPQLTLRGYELDDGELRRLEAVLAGTITLDRLLNHTATADGRRSAGDRRRELVRATTRRA